MCSKLMKNAFNFNTFLNLQPLLEKEVLPHETDTTIRKRKGIYYTPTEITFYICLKTFSNYIVEEFREQDFSFFDSVLQHDPKRFLEVITKVRVLDPACGAGIFLLQMAEILFQSHLFLHKKFNLPIHRLQIKQQILENNIFGVDLFEEAVNRAETRLLKWSSDDSRSSISNTIKLNLKVGNSLIGSIAEDNGDQFNHSMTDIRPFHWISEFPMVFKAGGFDIIVGNPPYVFIRGKNFSPAETAYYSKTFLSNYDSLAKGKARQSRKINTFSLFIIRAHQLLKPQGHLGFIIPNTILRTTTNDFIRQFILENTYIQEIVDLQDGIFKGITTSTILLFLQKTLDNCHPTAIISNVSDLLNSKFHFHYITQHRFSKNPVYAFNIHLDTELEAAFEEMTQNTVALGNLCREIIEGIVCRKSDGLFTEDAAHPLARKLVRGKNIGRYQINWPPNQYILYATDKSLTPKKLHRPRPQWVHESPEKLLTQRIGGGLYPLTLALDTSQYYTFASINNIILKDPLIYRNMEFNTKYILALLNSKLLNAYYLLNFSNLSSLTVNISKTFLESLPIKTASSQIQQLISTLADYLLFLYTYPEEGLKLCQFFDSWVTDSVIYELYYQNELHTDLMTQLTPYITERPSNASLSQSFTFFFQLLLQIQRDSDVLQSITLIKNHPTIKKIELLFEARDNLLHKTK
ncbi:MAG: hypothetical protein EU536_04765 [Promethearchaeota archaeon]|nr:MAG: hypothetical protein EU536_04765 [Candidatus Lokiarchaeota archaeon]